ncbi:MAG TPA: hypothetical protein VNG71_01390 [Pyrinomonadaceae bacterium]|nr:hypothetical protein [Pyrinomonadaceae bacterium]
MFETSVKPLRWVTVMKRVCIPLLALYLIIGAISAYRAWYQVRRLDLSVPTSALRPGAAVNYSVVSYARTTLDVRVELIQGTHSELIGTLFLRGNEWGFFDPRNKSAAKTTLVPTDILSRFDEGDAIVRATAIGREQWTRLPPPVIREVPITIQHE